MTYIDVANNTVFVKEKLNPILEEIMKSNGVEVVVGKPVVSFDLAHDNDVFNIGYRSRQHGKTNAIAQFADEVNFDLLSTEARQKFNNMFEQMYIDQIMSFQESFQHQYLGHYINDDFNMFNKGNIREKQDRLDQRELSLEEFKKEVLSGNRPTNNWFRNKHEKKRLRYNER